MSKKKNKKNKNKSYYSYAYVDTNRKHKKTKDKSNDERSVSKKDIERAERVIQNPVKVPKEFSEVRSRCNHAAKNLLTVDQYTAMTPAYGAYTPMLDITVAAFGKENVKVCPYCFDVLVDPGKFDVKTCQEAIAVLYAMANDFLSTRGKKKVDQIQEVNKLKSELNTWKQITNKYSRIRERVTDKATITPEPATNKLSDLNAINQAQTF